MADNKQRDYTLDVVKALGIILMVAGHCAFPLTHFVYLFHMALFFIASGYCFKENNSADYTSVTRFVKRKFVTLWFPYALWSTIYSLLHNFFIKINVYTDNPELLQYVGGDLIKTHEYWGVSETVRSIVNGLLLNSDNQLCEAFWFIAILLQISVFYCVLDYLLKRFCKANSKAIFIAQWVIAVVFLIVGFMFSIRVFSYYWLFHAGFTLKKFNLSNRERSKIAHILILVCTCVILVLCNGIGSVILKDNRYENPLFFVVVSIAGWQFIYELSLLLCKSSYVQKLFVCIGQNTLAVVILHYLCFKIINYIEVLVRYKHLFLVASFPYLHSRDGWWIAYVFVGIVIPVSLSLLWKKLKLKIKKV